jgi:adenosylcobyric acid synthase
MTALYDGDEMKSISSKVREELARGDIGPNLACPYHPSHTRGQNCSFCYCPFYPCKDPDLGYSSVSKKTGAEVWDCSQCLFIHRNDVTAYVFKRVRELNITDPDDPRLRGLLDEAKAQYFRKAKCLMVIGATSDAGKSVTVAALCRIISRRGYFVTPFKSQNMSLNSRVTRAGHEISMIQDLQCRAAGISSPTSHVNPILLKPKGDRVSQVIVEGVPVGDYSVESYYGQFVPGPGTEAVRRNIDFLRARYDFVIMEGAGSPAEINIYDQDIANMRAAEMADADCILVVNMDWGGSFAYAVGTVELLPDRDRKRVKGIILNNMRGRTDGLNSGIRKMEDILGIPVIGIIPHLDVRLPKEDSEFFRENSGQGSGKSVVAVIKLPRIANFTDIDPLCLEDVTIKFVTTPEEVMAADAIIIPGSKNTTADLEWLKSAGLDKAIVSRRGQVPILGICGGFQMMGRTLRDPNQIEDRYQESKGMGLFDMDVRWSKYEKRVVQDRGYLIDGGGEIEGYELHMGMSENVKEKPLFHINSFKGDFDEGCARKEEMLFGTYLHGLFEKPAFRRYFVSMMKHSDTGLPPTKDYHQDEDRNLDLLANGFEKALDMDALDGILGVKL